MSVLVLLCACFHVVAYALMPQHSSFALPFPYLFLAPKCLFFIRIFAKCVRREIMINLYDLSVNFASKAHNECIKHPQMLCNSTPNKHPQT